MMTEIFAKPCAAAIIEKIIDGEKCILLQTRQKSGGGDTNGKLELPAGKIREYEDVFSTIRREIFEETGLTVTKIYGEESLRSTKIGDIKTISFESFCITQNLSGAYSIILNTFICEAEGEPLASTDETQNIRWVNISEVRRIVENEPERVYFMHVNALKKYLNM